MPIDSYQDASLDVVGGVDGDRVASLEADPPARPGRLHAHVPAHRAGRLVVARVGPEELLHLVWVVAVDGAGVVAVPRDLEVHVEPSRVEVAGAEEEGDAAGGHDPIRVRG